MELTLTRSSPVQRTARVMQLEGIFELPPSEESAVSWEAHLPLEDRDWQVGLIVGPSGSGKTSLAREAWPLEIAGTHEWSKHRSVLDDFPSDMATSDVVNLLSSVGFSSPPSWLRPYGVLSTGEQFRVSIARTLADDDPLVVVDEFTSTVDRTVAQIGSCAIAKAVRARGQRFVAVTCHYDVEDWLQPDWTYQPHVDGFAWRSVQPRPSVDLDVSRCHSDAWRLFGRHHYLSDKLNKAAACWVGFWHDQPAVFLAVLPMPTRIGRNCWRAHRLVTLPDYQGVGIGNAFCDYLAGVYRANDRRFFVTTAHPARVGTLARNPLWRMTRKPSMTSATGDTRIKGMHNSRAFARLTAGFEYVGPAIDSALVV